MSREKPSAQDAMNEQNEWGDRAKCRGEDPTLWDTRIKNYVTVIDDDVRLAKTICGFCPVQEECLLHAIVFDMREGVWGGMVVEERDAFAIEQGLVEPVAAEVAA